MNVTLEYITPDAANFIGRMAGICYSAKDEREANIRRARKCKEDGHLATLRFATAVFNISGISRVCSHQFVRSKHLDFLQRSQRYCKEGQADYVVPPNLNSYQELIYIETVEDCFEAYQKLLDTGIKKEDARFVLPESTHTELHVVGNFQAWRDFIKLRYDPHAQAEIREVAKQINNHLADACPELFERIQ